MTSKERVLAVYPDAECYGPPVYVRPGLVDRPPDYFICTVEGSKHLGEGDTESEAWDDAASKLPTPPDMSAPLPAEEAAGTVWIDPRTQEPCKRCGGTGKMPPWPGSKGLVACGVCREALAPEPAVAPEPASVVPPFYCTDWHSGDHRGRCEIQCLGCYRTGKSAEQAASICRVAPEPNVPEGDCACRGTLDDLPGAHHSKSSCGAHAPSVLPEKAESADPRDEVRLLAEVMHLWIDGYISKAQDSCADDSISSGIFERIQRFLAAEGIEVDYCGWHRIAPPMNPESRKA